MNCFSFARSLALALPLAAPLGAQPAPPAGSPPAPADTTPKANGAALSEKTAADLLKSLNDIAAQLDAAKNKHTAAALEAFKAAMTSDDKAYSLFMDCKKKVDFDDKGRTGGEWGDWKRRDDTKALHEPEFTTALKLQLQWLVLTIQAANATTETSYGLVVSQVPAFLDSVHAAWKKMGPARREIFTDVIGSVYGRFYELDKTMEKRGGWSGIPGDFDQIYEQTILPYLRTRKNATALQAVWQKRISQESERLQIEERDDGSDNNGRGRGPRIQDNRGEERLIRFREEKLPRLQWGMMKDIFLAGNEASAAPQMLSHIRANLGHKDADNWIGEFARLLRHEPLETPAATAKAPATAAPAPAAVPAPAAAPPPAPAGTIRPIEDPDEAPAAPAPAPPTQPAKATSF